MTLELGKQYRDRKGQCWTILSTTEQRIAPVLAGRWSNGRYHTRTFQCDGKYWRGCDDPWDLIAEVTNAT